MMLVDTELRAWAANSVKPYTPECVNPASLDLHLGYSIKLPMWYWTNPITRSIAYRFKDKLKLWDNGRQFEKHVLKQGDFVLCHSLEVTTIPDDCIALLFSKSSTGRIGIEHLHAGFGDPNFSGQWTWELTNVSPMPVELIAGKRLMQIVLMRTNSIPEKLYSRTGRYMYQMGATEAR